MECLAQFVHQSCTDTNTVSKRTETRFDMTQVTLEFHRVSPKRFMSLWFIWGKPFTCLASRLVLAPNRLKRASTWASSPTSAIGCIQNDSWGMVRLAQTCTYLAPILAPSPNKSKHDSTWPMSPRSSVGCVQNDFQDYGTFGANVHLYCVKISTIFKQMKMSFHLSLITLEYHSVRPKWS
jgi:hypothetical protein